MNKKTITILLLGLMVAISLVYFFYQPKSSKESEEIIPASWAPSYKYNSRDPYGTYLFYELLKASTFDFVKVEGDPSKELEQCTKDSTNKLLVVCANTYPNYTYLWNSIREFVDAGNSVLFILENDPSELEESYHGIFSVNAVADSLTKLHFAKDPKTIYEFQKLDEFNPVLHQWKYFSVQDSLEINADTNSSYPGAFLISGPYNKYYFISHEENQFGKPVFVEMRFGEGALLIHRTPLAFTNIALLNEKNLDHVEEILDEINYDGIIYNTPSPLKMPPRNPKERKSPLQFILSDASLAWGYYIILGCLILFLIFNLKRKQASISLVPQKANSTLEFVDALSKIYYQKHNNKNIVKHKYRIFITFIRTHYHINLIRDKVEFARVISMKSGIELVQVEGILNLLDRYQKMNEVSDEQLIGLHKQLDNFYKKCK
jgi:hypothetical protein